MRPQYTSVFLVSLALGVHAQTLEVTPTGVAYGSAGTRTEGKTDAGQGGGRSGFYETANPSPAANWYPGASNWQHLIEARHSNLANNYALQIAGSFWGQELYFRKTADNPAQGWSKFVVENPAGNVGIGTVAPTEKLVVAGNLSVTGTISGAYFESAEQAYPTSGAIIVSVAHGLGVVPKRWNVVMRCKIAERGFSIGDEIDVSSLDGDYTNGVRNIWVNVTTLNLRRNSIDWLCCPDGSQVHPTPANWRIVFRAAAKY